MELCHWVFYHFFCPNQCRFPWILGMNLTHPTRPSMFRWYPTLLVHWIPGLPGMGEWNRDWSDMSKLWTDSLEKILGRSAVNDGTFWIDSGLRFGSSRENHWYRGVFWMLPSSCYFPTSLPLLFFLQICLSSHSFFSCRPCDCEINIEWLQIWLHGVGSFSTFFINGWASVKGFPKFSQVWLEPNTKDFMHFLMLDEDSGLHPLFGHPSAYILVNNM